MTRGFTMLELLIAIVIFILAYIPIATLFMSSQRTAYASERVLRASGYAQSLLEGIVQLEPSELPPPPAGVTGNPVGWLILVDDGPRQYAGTNASPRWKEVVDHFQKPGTVPFPMIHRSVSVSLFHDSALVFPKPDRYLIKVQLEFLRLTHDRETSQSRQEIRVQGMLCPKP